MSIDAATTSKTFIIGDVHGHYDGLMMLKAILIKDEGSSTIKITKFSTTFYN